MLKGSLPPTESPNDTKNSAMGLAESSQIPNAIPPRRSSSHHTRGSSNASDPMTTRTAMHPILEDNNAHQPQMIQPSMVSSSTPPLLGDGGVETVIHANGTTWSQEKERIVMGPYDYMENHPGKDIRKQFIAAFNAWLRVPKESLAIITRVVAMLHTASLLSVFLRHSAQIFFADCQSHSIDDVEDSSQLRRGVPVAHSIFGAAQTINSANYVYFGALQELLKLDNSRAIQIYTDELCNLHRGQGMDLFWRDTLTCPTEDDYLEMVGNKTGGLFRLAVQLMQAESKSEKDCTPLVNTIGLLFQIRDDYMNLASSEYASNKGLCEDLTEGKFSFPVIHSIRSNPSNRQLMNILKQKTEDIEVKKYAVQYMESTGSFEYCRLVLRELKRKALGMIETLDQDGDGTAGAGIKSILDKMDV